MYSVAGRLDPGTYFALARAVYAEMALAGITCVGEFHYLHHGPGGKRYRDPNEMGRVLIAAAAAAGLRITLLDACYLAGGFLPGGEPLPLAGVQLRFGDGSAAAWAERVSGFTRDSLGMVAPHARLGAAIHSVRAVSPDQMPEVMTWSHAHGAPVHAHLSEQPLENAECRAAFGATPAEVLYAAGALGPRSTMVHATHLTARDIELLGGSRSTVCMCPLTEADLADGVGPAPALAAAGSPLSLGSDGHSVIDLVEEARWLELSQRLVSRQRGHFTPADQAAGRHGERARVPGLAGRGRDRARCATRTWSRSRSTRPGWPAARARIRWPRCSRPAPRPTSGTWSRPASTWSATVVTCWSTTCRGELAAAISAVLD